MTLPSPKICQRIRKLFGLVGSPNAHEAERAREKLLKLLTAHGLTWNDLQGTLGAPDAADAGSAQPGAAAPRASTEGPEVNVLNLVLVLLEQHIAVAPDERMAIALWVLHTYVFGRFTITPRLALLSPVRGCGKSTLLVLLEMLTADAYRADNVTAAAIFHLLAHSEHTLLADEGDNLGLRNNSVLRAVFNAGHRRGGAISRFVGGWSRKFPVFAPLAIAAIGTLPMPLLHRAVIINMRRNAPGEMPLQELDEFHPTFPAAREQLQKWAATCSLARDPEMPPQLRNRAADNWRVLVAIGDDLGHGEVARAAAVALCAGHLDEDPSVVLLNDIRGVLDRLGVDRIGSLALVEALLALDDGLWLDWRGPHDDRPPRKLNQSEIARLLRGFGIRPRTIWPSQHRLGARSSRGYLRSQFEEAWAAYCPPADAPTQSSKIIQLPRA